MKLDNKQVAIVGGGPGGLTLARLLQLKGVHVQVYERDINRNARVQGSPLDLHEESGLAALREAGLLEEFRQGYMPGADKTTILDKRAMVHFSDHAGKPEANFESPHFRPEIDRGVLRNLLLESLQPETVVWDSHFISMKPEKEGWLLQFENGSSFYADIVIASDGANSKIRPYVTDSRPCYTGITMLEGTIYNAAEKAPAINSLVNGGKIMAFGDGKAILGGQKGDGAIGFYISFKTSADWAARSGLDFSNPGSLLEWFSSEYAGWDSVWNNLFPASEAPLIPRPIYCIPLDQDWEPLPNLTLIGDAAHVMPPFAGEGVNMAMMDALELSEFLTDDHYETVPAAISHYEKNMRARAAKVAGESVENGELMHSVNSLQAMIGFFKAHEG